MQPKGKLSHGVDSPHRYCDCVWPLNAVCHTRGTTARKRVKTSHPCTRRLSTHGGHSRWPLPNPIVITPTQRGLVFFETGTSPSSSKTEEIHHISDASFSKLWFTRKLQTKWNSCPSARVTSPKHKYLGVYLCDALARTLTNDATLLCEVTIRAQRILDEMRAKEFV